MPPMIWKMKRKALDLARRGEVMGVLNVTPDSFSDGGRFTDTEAAVRCGMEMAAQGAGILDVGGESTRPGSAAVPAGTECARTVPVIRSLRERWNGLISIDTSKAEVAAAALGAGADIVNDVTGLLGDPEMEGVCRAAECGVVVMHMQGDPRTMQVAPRYADVVEEVRIFLQKRFESLAGAGFDPERLCFDPGIGFGKTLKHNLELLRHLEKLAPKGRPLLLGVSRKSFIAKLLGNEDMSAREWPTVAVTAYARESGARVFRVHSVKENLEALRMVEAICSKPKQRRN
jgi:dihydropteroate synthase